MANYTKEKQLELVRRYSGCLADIDNQYKEVCLDAVKNDGRALKYVKEQTPEIYLEAVKNDGYVLGFVKEQTFELCLEAVKQNGYALECVKEQTPELCLEAIKENIDSIVYANIKTSKELEDVYAKEINKGNKNITECNQKTPKLCFYAFLRDKSLIKYKYIQKGIDNFIKNTSSFTNKLICINSSEYSLLEDKNISNYELINITMSSFKYLEKFLLNSNSNNCFILNSSIDIDINTLKRIALSNNKLIVVKSKYFEMNPIYNTLANKILTEEELLQESF